MRASTRLLAALAGTQVAYGKVPALRTAAGTKGIVGLMLLTSATDAAEARGRDRGPALVALAGGAGFLAELAGVATGRPFGHYTYSDKLGPCVRGVPVLAAAAWAMMARPAWVVAGRLSRDVRRRVPLAAAALTAWDVFLDPRMVREGYWTWREGGPWRFEDVPASNFLGWLVTGTGLFAAWALVDPADEPEVNGNGALALYAWTWVGETFANAVIWKRPRVAVAGGLAMGALLVPAVLRKP